MRKNICLLIGFLITVHTALYGQEAEGDNEYQYALIEAVKQKNLGNIPGAIKLYKLVLKENNNVPVANFELGSLYLMKEEPAKAKNNFQKAYEEEPQNYWYIKGYVEILIIQEEYKQAEKVLVSAIESNIKKTEMTFKYANVLAMRGKERKALRVLRDIEKNKGISEKVTLLRANIYEQEKKFLEARKEMKKLIEVFPEAVQFHVMAAELSLKGGKNDEAAAYYEEVIALDSNNVFALTNLADYYRKKGDMKKSLNYLAKSFNDKDIRLERKISIFRYYAGNESYIEKYYPEMNQLIKSLMDTYPQNREVNFVAFDFYIEGENYENALQIIKPMLGESLKRYESWRQGMLLANITGNYSDLINISQQALNNFPDSTEAEFFMALGYYEEEIYDTAFMVLDELEIGELDERNATQVEMLKAESLHQLKRYEEADNMFRRIIKENPENYMVLNNYSYYLANREVNLNDARKWSKKVISKNPENYTFLDTHAWVLYKIGELESAEKYINRAIESGGENDPEINEHAGDIQKALGSYEIAVSFYNKAIILGGDKERIEKKIGEIREEKNK